MEGGVAGRCHLTVVLQGAHRERGVRVPPDKEGVKALHAYRVDAGGEVVSGCSLEGKRHVHLGEHSYILAVQSWRQGSDSKDSGEKTCAELRNRKGAHGGSPWRASD